MKNDITDERFEEENENLIFGFITQDDITINGLNCSTSFGFTVGAIRAGRRYAKQQFNRAVIRPIFGEPKPKEDNGLLFGFIHPDDLMINGASYSDSFGYTVGAYRALKRRLKGIPTPKVD